ncbi:MAG: ATP-binding protein, partial [Gammaproteobacteria bacterium]|nr:ATP-binding protein [Gammaproteobacteria bacterium]
MNNEFQTQGEFDLQPDPRILPMLGEINLSQWRCLAELVDNSVDGFLSAKRKGNVVTDPEVHISIPTSNNSSAQISVRDNGPGMSPETLETAVRAGWSGNTPVDSLGMFGMGFNIATARIGTVTTVWTTRREDAEWHGLKIDFNALQKQRHFRTPHLKREKIDPHEHGTEVIIETLNSAQRSWFSRAAGRTQVTRELSKTYSAMLRNSGVPISFSLFINGNKLQARYPCIWGEERIVENPRSGSMRAFQTIDRNLTNRPFCLSCWQWLPAEQMECSCGHGGQVIQRERRVHGWLGVQRYLSNSEYGLDFIRNGRKIEISNRDLFFWHSDDGEEPEYPIDDPRNRGRLVGEIHLDHCRVTYTKDRFDRNDPAWEEMVRIVRGEGPLRPDKARELGFGLNDSPLFQLFHAFRRSTPKPKVAGSWARLLIVRDNELAEKMAKKFHSGDPEYQEDSNWWELVEEEDRLLLVEPDSPGDEQEEIEGFGNEGDGEETEQVDPPEPPIEPEPTTNRTRLASLSQEYRHDRSNQRWDVRAWAVEEMDPELITKENPWRLTANASGEHEFLVNPIHDVFRSATLTTMDALLAEIAWSAKDFLRGEQSDLPFGLILADLRGRYSGTTKLDPITLSNEASLSLTD